MFAAIRPQSLTRLGDWLGDAGLRDPETRGIPPSTGGWGGIRTHDTLLTYTHFPGARLRPLGHPSGASDTAPLAARASLRAADHSEPACIAQPVSGGGRAIAYGFHRIG